MSPTYTLTLSCPDRPGIVHAVSGFLLERGGNIEEAAQYNDHATGLFFMCVQFACDQVSEADLSSPLGMISDARGGPQVTSQSDVTWGLSICTLSLLRNVKAGAQQSWVQNVTWGLHSYAS